VLTSFRATFANRPNIGLPTATQSLEAFSFRTDQKPFRTRQHPTVMDGPEADHGAVALQTCSDVHRRSSTYRVRRLLSTPSHNSILSSPERPSNSGLPTPLDSSGFGSGKEAEIETDSRSIGLVRQTDGELSAGIICTIWDSILAAQGQAVSEQ